MCVGHQFTWQQHPLACYKSICCGADGTKPVPSAQCPTDQFYDAIAEQCKHQSSCFMTTIEL